MATEFPYRRIAVIGVTSSGKSTLAKTLSERLGLDLIELDAIYWQANWTPIEPNEFRERVETATRSTSWVVAGNYRAVLDIVWPRAQVIIWLDLPFHVVFWRLLARSLRRGLKQEELWNGNREPFWPHLKFWSDESLFRWLFKTYWRRKREIPIFLSLPWHDHLKSFRFKTQREVDDWLVNLQPVITKP